MSRTVAGTKAGDAPRRVPALAYLVIWGEALEAAAGGALAKQGLEGFCRRRHRAKAPEDRDALGGCASVPLRPPADGGADELSGKTRRVAMGALDAAGKEGSEYLCWERRQWTSALAVLAPVMPSSARSPAQARRWLVVAFRCWCRSLPVEELGQYLLELDCHHEPQIRKAIRALRMAQIR